jgi:hypothetical protein
VPLSSQSPLLSLNSLLRKFLVLAWILPISLLFHASYVHVNWATQPDEIGHPQLE